MNIGKFSVKNPVLINLVMVILFILGIFSIARLPREQFAEVPFFWVNIVVPYPGVSAPEVEQSVIVPIEREFQNLPRVKQISSTAGEGLGVVRVEFDDDVTADEFGRLYQEVQTQFSRVRLPDGVIDPRVDDFSSGDFVPVIEVILYGEIDFPILVEAAENLQQRVEGIREVSEVVLIGSREREIAIELDPNRMEALGISLNEVVQAVEGRSAAIPGGLLETTTREYLLRTVSGLKGAEDFKDIIVRRSGNVSIAGPSQVSAPVGAQAGAGGAGDPSAGIGAVLVRDVAEVEEKFERRGIISRYNGQRAVTLRVTKVTKGNAISIVADLQTELEQFSSVMPPGIGVALFNDSTIQIQDSISVLVSNGIFGFLLLILILYLFIGFRNALITGIGIPLAFAITFIVLEYMGETLNSNTLFGLVLVLGLVVDHAIVIVENSYRLKQNGYSNIDAAIEGTNQVVKPVITATLTTVAAFLPLMFLPGIIGRFLRVIPLVVSIALIASTFEALFFLPSHFAEWSGKKGERKLRFFDKFQQFFTGVASRVYKHRRISVLVMILIMLGSFALVPFLQQDLFSAEDFSVFYIDIEMPPGTPMEKTDQLVKEYEKIIMPLIGNGEIEGVNSAIGFQSGTSSSISRSSVAQISVDIVELSDGRERPIVDILQEIQEMCEHIPGAEQVLFRRAQTGPPTAPPVSFRIFGDRYEDLEAVGSALQAKLTQYPELYNIQDNLETGNPELQIRIRESLASRYGLSAGEIGNFIRGGFDGFPVTTLFIDNREVPVIVRLGQEQIQQVQELMQLRIPTRDGRLVPFSAVAEIDSDTSLASIRRLDGRREATVFAEAFTNENVRSINQDIRQYFEQELSLRYPGVVLQVGGEFAELDNLLIQIARIFLLGLFGIYIILGTQFNSYTQPFLILFSIPFAFVGIILFLVLSGTPFSTTVLYAGIALAGIAVNDSIVLIDFINSLRIQGRSTMEAVVEGISLRLRPVLITSVTTIAGLLPTALGLGGKSVVWGPMANTIIFGLIFSTLTALLVVPCMYGLLDDVKKRRAKVS